MPSFESIRPFKRARVNSSDDITGCDRQGNDWDSSLAKSYTHAEGNNQNEKPGFLKKTWKRCKRPGSALVARHIGQPILAKTSLVLLSTSLHNPTSNTVDVSMRVTLTLPVPFPVLLQPMVVHLCRKGHAPDDPFLEVALPACQIRRSAEIEVNGKTTNVLNMEQFGDVINDAMFNESVMLGINGSAKVQFHGVTSRLHLDDHVEVKGLGSFPGFMVKSCQILIPKAPDWALFEVVLDLPNPSLATIEMGDLTLNVYIGPVVVGEAFVSNATFTPGPNTVSSRVYLDKKKIMSNITTIIQSQKELLCRGKLGVRVSGKSTVRNGENLVYYENALSKLQLYSMLPLSRIICSTVGGIAESVTPVNIMTLLRTMGIMAILEGNGVDVAQLTQLHEQPE